MIEVERKFRLDPEQKKRILSTLEKTYGKLKAVRQSDKVFRAGVDSLENFASGEHLLRLRTINGQVVEFNYKQPVTSAGDSIEHELTISSGEDMQNILELLNYKLVVHVDKERIEVKDDDLTLVLDTVAHLGDFMEIEMLTDDKGIAEAENKIMRKAAEFGLGSRDIETKKYDRQMHELKKNGSIPK